MKPVTSSTRDRVVHPRLALERAGQPAAQLRAAQDGEDRGAVGRGDRGADDQATRACPGRTARSRPPPAISEVTSVPTIASEMRRAEHRPDLAPAGRQPALEEDQDQADRAERAGQLDVVEVDPADAVAADEHPEPEEEHQTGHADPVGDERRDDARSRAGGRRSGSGRRRTGDLLGRRRRTRILAVSAVPAAVRSAGA